MVRLFNMHIPVPVVVLGAVDVIILYFSVSGGLALSYAPDTVIFSFFADEFALQKAAFIAITFVSLFVIGAYSKGFLTDLKMGLLAILVGHLLGFAILSIAFYLYQDLRIWLSALLPSLVLSLTGVFLSHLAFDRLVGIRLFRRRLLIVGAGPTARRIAAEAETSPYLTCIGFVPMGESQVSVPEHQILRDPRPLVEIAQHHEVDEIVIAAEERRRHLQTDQLLQCRLRGVQVSDPSTFIEREQGRVEVDALYPSWMIFGPGFHSVGLHHRIAKRLFDFLVSSVMLVFLSPLVLVIALGIWASDGAPILYRQARVGLNGRVFSIWKFRSMRRDSESDGTARWATADDARVTWLGRILRRFRFDELPQLWNVLRGEMSFIGPRPERPEIVKQLVAQIPYYDCRHSVKPGISGWAQLNFPYGASLEDAKRKLNYDLYYVKNYSLVLDFLVLLQTARVIIWPKESTRSGSVPATEAQEALERRPGV